MCRFIGQNLPLSFLVAIVLASLFTSHAFAASALGKTETPNHLNVAFNSSCTARDDEAWESCCASTQIAEEVTTEPAIRGSTGTVIVTLYYSSGCKSVWTGIANKTNLPIRTDIYVYRGNTGVYALADNIPVKNSASSPQLVVTGTNYYQGEFSGSKYVQATWTAQWNG